MAAISSAVLRLREAGRPHRLRQPRLSRRLPPVRDAAEALGRRGRLCRRRATRTRSRRRCRAPRCSTWRARPAGSSRPTTSRALAALARARMASSPIDRQQLGEPDLPAAARASASTSSCIPPRNISAATATWWPAWSPDRTSSIGQIRRTTLPYLGGKLSPFDAWLLLRGLRTLPIRMRAHEARGLVDRAAARRRIAAVTRVHHPGLGNHAAGRASPAPPACSRSSSTPGIDIPAFCDALRLFKLGVSWGGHESLVCRPQSCASRRPGPIPPSISASTRAYRAAACRARRRRGAVERPGGRDRFRRARADLIRNQATEEEKHVQEADVGNRHVGAARRVRRWPTPR